MKPSAYLAVWLRLLTRSPAELAAERLARHPAPPPHRKQGTKQALQRTQTDGVLPVPHLPKRSQP
ncbi:hypothetical protein [Acidithiobacillus concretivorus]|uniref:Uncharacterized protein n=1 Tax=Acidithiobacillus concretivorus TaxID=3063952 RepID=A0ABS5ZTN9_9PROT|nr:hypothetical protein [Acidithiobacillus concretivorus]MBU2739872.1 hypothetical protein [Acidithiobacillus concretivorus]